MNGLERLGRRIADEQDVLRMRSSSRAAVRERIAAHEPKVQRSRRWWLLAVPAALLAGAAAIALVRHEPEERPLTLHLASSTRQVLPGAWLEAPAGSPALALRFSDGSHIDLTAGTRARVVELDPHGAHLMLESGVAQVAIVHHAGTEYRLSVGPFAVRVIGTRFDVRWNPEQDELGIDLKEGRVELSGCVFGRSYAMRAGQHLGASCKGNRFHVEVLRSPLARAGNPELAEAPPRSAGALPVTEAKAASVETDVRPAAPSAQEEQAATKNVRAAKDWRVLARKGQYAAAFALADTNDAGFETECERADGEDLALLAEIARYAGQRSHEDRALRLMRRRFEGTPRAALAAFALGRLEFDERHAYAKAARWFDTYLKEQPDGALSREARGRLIEAAIAAGDRGWARTLAADYLREHPNGPHGELARRQLSDSSTDERRPAPTPSRSR